MTTTDELIRDLAADVRPLPRGAASRRLGAGIAIGAAASMIAASAWMGAPLQAAHQTGAAALAMKLLYSVALFAMASTLLLGVGSPGVEVRNRWLWLLAPPAVLAVSATVELSMAVREQRQAIWLGSMSWMCTLTIILLSAPILAGVLWAFQQLAPTRLRLAGLLAGMTAGSAAAAIYALYCPETTATFLLTWYSLAILASGLAGALTGPRLLRW